MREYGIKLGSILFTLVEPHRGHEVAYNRWYERDHFYAGCMIGPACFAGRRFVATRPYKDLRTQAPSPMTPDPMTGSYLAIYWILAGHHDEWNRWAVDQVHRLHRDGRMFAQRDHVHTLLYDFEWAVQRDPEGVSAELALDHPFSGLVVTAGEVHEGTAREEATRWYRDEYLPELQSGSATALSLSFNPLPLLGDAPSDVPRVEGSERRFMQLHFLDADPVGSWASHFEGYGDAFEATGLGAHLWTGPFIPTLPGTDTYTDNLW